MVDNNLLNHVLNQFVTAIQTTWWPLLEIYGIRILLLIAGLQIAMIAVGTVLTRNVTYLVDDLVTGLIRIGACWFVFTNAATFGQAVIDTGTHIGQAISTWSPLTLTPSGVLNQGLQLAAIVWQSKASGSWLTSPVQDLEFFFVGAVIVTCWTGGALIYLGSLLEAAALVYGGPIVIAFTPLHWTAELLVRWALSVLGVAIKIAILLMTLAVGMAIAQGWTIALNEASATLTTNLGNLVIAAVESLVFVYLVMKLPALFTNLIGGSPLFTFGESFISMTMGALGGAAASAATSAGSAAGSAAADAVSSGASCLNQVARMILFGDNAGGSGNPSNPPTAPPSANTPTQTSP
jgi:P-type conjugative transfer protein TrbL